MRQRLNFYASAFERSMTVAAKLKKKLLLYWDFSTESSLGLQRMVRKENIH